MFLLLDYLLLLRFFFLKPSFNVFNSFYVQILLSYFIYLYFIYDYIVKWVTHINVFDEFRTFNTRN